MPLPIDKSLYPDRPAPAELVTPSDRSDFLERLCAAWDFGRLPDAETIHAIRLPDWREIVDSTRLLTSPAYHLLRRWHGLPELAYTGQRLPHIWDDPSLQHV